MAHCLTESLSPSANSDLSDDENKCPTMKRATQTSVTSAYVPDVNEPSQLFGGSKSIFHSNVYLSCIGQKMKPSKLIPASILVEDDEDDDDKEFFKKKSKGKTQSKKTSKKGTKPNRKKPTNSPKKYCTVSSTDEDDDDKPHVIFLEDEDTDVDTDHDDTQPSSSQTREPTPPPTPPDNLPSRSKRMKRSVKTAFKKLAKAAQIHSEMTEDMLHDGDLSIIEVISPVRNDHKEMSVKIKSRSGVQRFPMKKSDSFVHIFQALALHESVSENQITLFLNDRRVNLYDTPVILGLEVADIIECYIRKPEEVAADDDNSLLDDLNKIILRVQTKDAKSPLSISMGLEESMEKLMREFCRKQTLCYDDVAFYFDGEYIHSHQTPNDLELEDDFCIDVVEL